MKAKKRDILISTAASLLPFVLIFWTIPFDILRANWSEFGYRWALLAPYVGVLIFLMAAIAFGRSRSDVEAGWAVSVFTTLGFILLGLEIFTAGGLSETPSGFVLGKPALALVLSIAFAAALFSYILLRALGKHSYLKVCAVMSVSFVLTGLVTSLADTSAVKQRAVSLQPTSFTLAERPNVYHFMLDAFSADVFLTAIERAKEEVAFDGFVFFNNTFSNFTRTQESVPSFLTASLPDWGHMRDWSMAFHESGIFSEVKAAGYRVWSYASEQKYLPLQSNIRKSFQTVRKNFRTSLPAWFADVWLARSFSFLLPENFAQGGIGPVSRIWGGIFGFESISGTSILSRKLFQEALHDEQARNSSGEYTYIHLLLPHSPYNFTSDCEVSPDITDYYEQSTCTIRLVAKFIKQLEELGRLKSSIVIVQSDHGEYFARPTFESRMSDSMSASIQKNDSYGFSGHDIERRVKALLLIKPPNNQSRKLQLQSELTQLLDIPVTLYSMLKMSVQAPVGANLFSNDVKQKRAIDIFDGFVIKGTDKARVLRFGEQFFSGDMNHYSYTNEEGWQELAKQKAHW